MIGGTVGQLFVLFGVKTDQAAFKVAKNALNTLKAAAAVTGIVRLGQELVGMATHAAESATHILGMSSALGMSTKTVQEWSYVAQQAGSDINQFSVGISMFERNLREFAAGRGSKRFIDSMHAVRITSGEAKRDLAGPDGVNAAIFKVSDAYLRMGNSANRASINTGLFGARARGMAQDLGRGSAMLRQQIGHLHEIGGVVNEDKLLKAKAFNNSINDIKVSLSALAMEVTAAVGPGFSKMLEGAVKWISANKTLISDILIGALTALGAAFKVVMVIVEAFVFVLNKLGNKGIIAVLTAIAAVIMYTVAPALYVMAGAVWAVIAPLLLPMAIIAGIVYAILELQEHWDEVAEALTGAWDVFSEKAAAFFTAIGRGILAVGRFFGNLSVRILGDIVGLGVGFKGLEVSIKDALVGVWDFVWAPVKKIIDWITGKLDALEERLAKIRDFFLGSEGETDAQGNQTKKPEKPSWGVQIFEGLIGAGPEVAAFNAMRTEANPPAGSAAAVANNNNTSRTTSVSVGPTTVNINGVQGAAQARDNIAEAIDGVLRHANASMGGEVQ